MCAETTTNRPSSPIGSAAALPRTGTAMAGWICVVAAGRHLAKLCDHLLSAMERWRQRRALMMLDDHLLSDIGVSRADVEREVGKSIWRD